MVVVIERLLAFVQTGDSGIGTYPDIAVAILADGTYLRVYQSFGIAESLIIVGCPGIWEENGTFARGYPYTSLRIGCQGIDGIRRESVVFLVVVQQFSLQIEDEDAFTESPYP